MQTNGSPKSYLGTLLLMLVVLTGCSTTIASTRLYPAKAHEAAGFKRIAVLPFAGDGGTRTSAALETFLARVHLNDEPYFQVIERATIQRILGEQNLLMTGAIDEKTAVEVGKFAGAEGVVFGDVAHAITDKPVSEKRSKCSARNRKGRCAKWSIYDVICVERSAYFYLVPKVVNVTTGDVVVSKTLVGLSTDRACQDSSLPLQNSAKMLASARYQTFEKFRALIAPYHSAFEIKLLEKDNTTPPAPAMVALRRGIYWAKNGRMDRACGYWHRSFELHREGYAIHYLLGVCAETSGNLEVALFYYDQADRMTERPVQEITQALGRIRRSIQSRSQVQEQLHHR